MLKINYKNFVTISCRPRTVLLMKTSKGTLRETSEFASQACERISAIQAQLKGTPAAVNLSGWIAVKKCAHFHRNTREWENGGGWIHFQAQMSPKTKQKKYIHMPKQKRRSRRGDDYVNWKHKINKMLFRPDEINTLEDRNTKSIYLVY